MTWWSILEVPDWAGCFPRRTRLALAREPAESVLLIRTGDLVSAAPFGEIIGWLTPTVRVDAAWSRLMLLHWWRLAHARGGYS